MRTGSFPFSHTWNEEVELEDGYGSSSSKEKKKGTIPQFFCLRQQLGITRLSNIWDTLILKKHSLFIWNSDSAQCSVLYLATLRQLHFCWEEISWPRLCSMTRLEAGPVEGACENRLPPTPSHWSLRLQSKRRPCRLTQLFSHQGRSKLKSLQIFLGRKAQNYV